MNANETISTTRASVESQESLVARVTDAHKALEIASKSYKQAWLEWRKISETMLPECRSFRMAVDGELSKTLKALEDVRIFFLSPDHDKEVARLKEFTDLCERLKALKDSGFLDRVSDTILRLEVGHE